MSDPTPAAREYARLTLEWHVDWMRNGRDDTPEADAHVDRREALWAQLTKDEQFLLRELSASLYSVTGAERLEVFLSPAVSLREEVGKAWRAKDWRALVTLTAHKGLDEGDRVRLRAEAWRGLGYIEIADLFERMCMTDRLRPKPYPMPGDAGREGDR